MHSCTIPHVQYYGAEQDSCAVLSAVVATVINTLQHLVTVFTHSLDQILATVRGLVMQRGRGTEAEGASEVAGLAGAQ